MLHKFGFDCVGTEISTEAVEKAKQLYGIDLIYGYVEDMNFKDESFDIITMWHVFEHLPYPGRTLEYLNKKLKRGGYIFMAVPNNSFGKRFYSLSFLCASKKKRLETLIPPIIYEGKFKEIHLIHYTPSSLRKIVEKNGFKLEELSIDNISLNPGMLKDLKYYLRNRLAQFVRIYAHQALFLCAQKSSAASLYQNSANAKVKVSRN